MSSHFRLRRRDLRWLLFPAMAVAAGALVVLIVVFTPGRVLAGYEFSRAESPSPSISASTAREALPQAE